MVRNVDFKLTLTLHLIKEQNMMFKKMQIALSLVVLLVVVNATDAESISHASSTKTYTLTKLRQVVSNHDECSAFYKDLKQLTKNPVSLQFAPSSKSRIAAKDSSGQVANHSHSIVKQKVEGGTVHRVVTGEFKLNKQKVDYVAEISANLNNADHQYLYPIILASHNAQCYYTALIKPSDDTVAAFKKSIQSGHAAKGTDIHQK